MYRLIRMTSNDYRDYRRTATKIEYSYWPKGQEIPGVAHMIAKIVEFAVLGKGEFLDLVEKDEKEFYFLKEDDQIVGITQLVFSEKSCLIAIFAVLEHGKGLGTILYQETLKVIKERKVAMMEVWCPFAGAQIFWSKMGFRNGNGRILQSRKGNMFTKKVR